MTDPVNEWGPHDLVGHPAVATVAYDPTVKEMAVKFLSGDTYVYSNVDVLHFRNLYEGPGTGMFGNGPEAVVWNWRKV